MCWFGPGYGLFESPCECGIKTPGSISHGVNYILQQIEPGTAAWEAVTVSLRHISGHEWSIKFHERDMYIKSLGVMKFGKWILLPLLLFELHFSFIFLSFLFPLCNHITFQSTNAFMPVYSLHSTINISFRMWRLKMGINAWGVPCLNVIGVREKMASPGVCSKARTINACSQGRLVSQSYILI